MLALSWGPVLCVQHSDRPSLKEFGLQSFFSVGNHSFGKRTESQEMIQMAKDAATTLTMKDSPIAAIFLKGISWEKPREALYLRIYSSFVSMGRQRIERKATKKRDSTQQSGRPTKETENGPRPQRHWYERRSKACDSKGADRRWEKGLWNLSVWVQRNETSGVGYEIITNPLLFLFIFK